MATNDRNSQDDRNRDDLNRNENLRGEAGNTSSSSQHTDWDKKSQEQGQAGMEGEKASRTTNPSAMDNFEANRDRNKYDDTDQESQNRDESGSTGRNNEL